MESVNIRLFNRSAAVIACEVSVLHICQRQLSVVPSYIQDTASEAFIDCGSDGHCNIFVSRRCLNIVYFERHLVVDAGRGRYRSVGSSQSNASVNEGSVNIVQLEAAVLDVALIEFHVDLAGLYALVDLEGQCEDLSRISVVGKSQAVAEHNRVESVNIRLINRSAAVIACEVSILHIGQRQLRFVPSYVQDTASKAFIDCGSDGHCNIFVSRGCCDVVYYERHLVVSHGLNCLHRQKDECKSHNLNKSHFLYENCK